MSDAHSSRKFLEIPLPVVGDGMGARLINLDLSDEPKPSRKRAPMRVYIFAAGPEYTVVVAPSLRRAAELIQARQPDGWLLAYKDDDETEIECIERQLMQELDTTQERVYSEYIG